MLTLVNPEGSSVGELDFAKTTVRQIKLDKCLIFDQILENGHLLTTIQKISSLEGYTIKNGNTVVATLTGEVNEIVDTLKEVGFSTGVTANEFSEVAKEILEKEDVDDKKHINIVVKLDDEVEVKFAFDRDGLVPTVDKVKKLLFEDEAYKSFAKANEFVYAGMYVDGTTEVALTKKTKLSKDTTLKLVGGEYTPSEDPEPEYDFYKDANNFEAVDANAEFDSNATYYTVADGTYTVANIEAFAEGTTYYTIKFFRNPANFTAVPAETAFDNSVTYFTLTDGTYAEATGITEFAENVTYYTLKDGVTLPEDNPSLNPVVEEPTFFENPNNFTAVDANAEFDSSKTYYTLVEGVYTEATELEAFAEGVTYYTLAEGVELPVEEEPGKIEEPPVEDPQNP